MNTISITHLPLANGMPDQRSAKILWIHSPLTDGHMTSGHNIRSESMTGGQVTGGHYSVLYYFVIHFMPA
jgi:hypothetical protein